VRRRERGRVLAVVIEMLIGGAAVAATAETWRINAEGTGDAPTLQAAIDAAESGDTILLAPGVYRDRVTRSVQGGGETTAVAFLERGLTIAGEDPFVTFIDGEEDHQCLVGENLDRDTKLQRITLLHGDALGESAPAARGGGGLLLYESSPKLEDLRFVGCNSLDGGGGLRVVGGYDDQRIDISGCAFVFCWSGGRGGGIEMIDLGDADLKRNTFAGNFSQVRGGALALVGFSARVSNNVWWLNCAHEKAGSLSCEDADVDAECNIFWQNIPEIGEGDLECKVRIGDGEEANRIVDPLFCDTQAENFGIDADSPASPKQSDDCGLIGAYGPACGVRPGHVSRVTGLAPEPGPLRVQISPNPAAEAARVSVAGERADEATVEIFDLAGRRVRQLAGRGGPFVWDGRDANGRRVAGGIYFARVAAGPETVVARVVVIERR
jgi:hypothetical protein